MKISRRVVVKLFALLLWSTSLWAEGSYLVYKEEYVIRVKEEYCPWGTPCSKPLEPGIYLFTGTYLGQKRQGVSGLQVYSEDRERSGCSRFEASAGVSCSANFFVTKAGDPELGKQWHHGALNTARVWREAGSLRPDKTIAIIDTGVDCDGHPDLSCLRGYDAFSDSHNSGDSNGHGTHVAGIAAATIDNGIGIAGMVGAKILPVKVLGDNGGGSTYTVMKGFKWASENGANIINMSLGGGGHVEAFQELIHEAHNKGIIIVAAAGNSHNDNDTFPHYPSNYEHVISVGALDPRGQRATFSNYGETVDVWAPGVEIYSTYLGGGYRNLSGTSMASPIVAGAIALLGKSPERGTLYLRKPPCDKAKLGRCKKKCNKQFRCRCNKKFKCKQVCEKGCEGGQN